MSLFSRLFRPDSGAKPVCLQGTSTRYKVDPETRDRIRGRSVRDLEQFLAGTDPAVVRLWAGQHLAALYATPPAVDAARELARQLDRLADAVEREHRIANVVRLVDHA